MDVNRDWGCQALDCRLTKESPVSTVNNDKTYDLNVYPNIIFTPIEYNNIQATSFLEKTNSIWWKWIGTGAVKV